MCQCPCRPIRSAALGSASPGWASAALAARPRQQAARRRSPEATSYIGGFPRHSLLNLALRVQGFTHPWLPTAALPGLTALRIEGDDLLELKALRLGIFVHHHGHHAAR